MTKYETYKIEMECAIYGKTFIKRAPAHKYCDECRPKVSKKQQQDYYLNNLEKCLEQQRLWRKNNPDYYVKYRKKHKQYYQKYYKEYRKKYLKNE